MQTIKNVLYQFTSDGKLPDPQDQCPLVLDLIVHIFLQVDFNTKLSFLQTCRLWKQVLDIETNWLFEVNRLGIAYLKYQEKSSKQMLFAWHQFQSYNASFIVDFPPSLFWKIYELPQVKFSEGRMGKFSQKTSLYRGFESISKIFYLVVRKKNDTVFQMQLKKAEKFYWLLTSDMRQPAGFNNLQSYLTLIKHNLDQQDFEASKNLFEGVTLKKTSIDQLNRKNDP